jgi:hypothetical protein
VFQDEDYHKPKIIIENFNFLNDFLKKKNENIIPFANVFTKSLKENIPTKFFSAENFIKNNFFFFLQKKIV